MGQARQRVKRKHKPTNRQRRGRPKLPDDVRLGSHIPVRLMDAEKLEVAQAADALDIPLAAWVREAIREKLTRDRAAKG